MPIEFACQCGKRYRVDDSLAGRRSRCKQCQAVLVVPEPEPEVPELIDDAFASEWGVQESTEPGAIPLGGPPLGSMGTSASLPAQLGIHWGKFVTAFPVTPLVFLVALLFSLLATLLVHAVFLVGVVLTLIFAGLWLRKQRLKFIYGDVSPAIVVGQDPWTVAVYTDLAKSPAVACPCLKVIRQPLDRMTGGPPRVGMPLATSSFYVPGDNHQQKAFWSDFEPTVVQCVSNDRVAIQRTMDRISPLLWKCLDLAIKQTPNLQPGLYTFWDENQVGRRAGRQFLHNMATIGVGGLAFAVTLFFMIKNGGKGQPAAPQAAAAPPAMQAPLQNLAPPQAAPAAALAAAPVVAANPAAAPAAAPAAPIGRQPANPVVASPVGVPPGAPANNLAEQARKMREDNQARMNAMQQKMQADREQRQREQDQRKRERDQRLGR